MCTIGQLMIETLTQTVLRSLSEPLTAYNTPVYLGIDIQIQYIKCTSAADILNELLLLPLVCVYVTY